MFKEGDCSFGVRCSDSQFRDHMLEHFALAATMCVRCDDSVGWKRAEDGVSGCSVGPETSGLWETGGIEELWDGWLRLHLNIFERVTNVAGGVPEVAEAVHPVEVLAVSKKDDWHPAGEHA